MKSKLVVYTGMVAAIYWVLSMTLAPISFGPIQLRVACALYPLVFFNPIFIFGIALGNFLTNLSSPFGAYDVVLMPFFALFAGYIGWKLRKIPILASIIQALIVATTVSIFPLWLGGGFSPIGTFPGILLSQLIVILSGWFIIWRPLKSLLSEKLSLENNEQ